MLPTPDPLTPRPKAVAYCRVSSADQEERGTIAMQQDRIPAWCATHGIDLLAVYSDEDVSGTILLPHRPSGAQLLTDAPALRRQGVSLVLLYDWSRIGRDPVVLWDAVRYLERDHGFRIRSVTEQADTSTPEAVLMLCVQAGVANYEREKFLSRARDATEMLVRQGVWVGGIVPYGYRVKGSRREARLVVSEEPIPGRELSEADVIRMIYRLCVEERQSCIQIATTLNALAIPTHYGRDEREVTQGKRKERTRGKWGSGRIVLMIKNEVYRGEHIWGKRAKKGARETITREVAAIVDAETWHAAQAVLKSNHTWSKRNTKAEYLLRGLMKCAGCGCTYVGGYYPHHGSRFYYCNNYKRHINSGKETPRCQSRGVRCEIEDLVWADIEEFLRCPEEVLAELQATTTDISERERLRLLHTDLARQAGAKSEERSRILRLFRKGVLEEADVERQLLELRGEELELSHRRDQAAARLASLEAEEEQTRGVEELLSALARRIDAGVDFETKRRIVEVLVAGITVETREVGKRKEATVRIRYRFSTELPTVTRTGKDSLLRRRYSGRGRRARPLPVQS